jgi:hypothetical protein
LLSTLVLIAAGYATATLWLVLAAGLITLGMLIGSGWLRAPRRITVSDD